MAYESATFQTGPNGAAFSPSDEPMVDSVLSETLDATFTYTDADGIAGPLSLQSAQDQAPSYLSVLLPPGTTLAYQSLYMRVDRADHSWLCGAIASASVGIPITSARVRGNNGLCQLRDRYTAEATSSHAFADGDWLRADHTLNLAGNSQTIDLFWGANLHGTTPDETLTGTMDDLGATEIYGLTIGPYAVNSAASPLYGLWRTSLDAMPPPWSGSPPASDPVAYVIGPGGAEIAADGIYVITAGGTEVPYDSPLSVL